VSTTTIQAPADRFISAAQAIRENPGLTTSRIYVWAARQEIRVELPAGRPPKYSASDIARALASVES
jgi:hypothetical protein